MLSNTRAGNKEVNELGHFAVLSPLTLSTSRRATPTLSGCRGPGGTNRHGAQRRPEEQELLSLQQQRLLTAPLEEDGCAQRGEGAATPGQIRNGLKTARLGTGPCSPGQWTLD